MNAAQRVAVIRRVIGDDANFLSGQPLKPLDVNVAVQLENLNAVIAHLVIRDVNNGEVAVVQRPGHGVAPGTDHAQMWRWLNADGAKHLTRDLDESSSFFRQDDGDVSGACGDSENGDAIVGSVAR